MSKAVLISIHPKWCELIANGKKTIEARKNKPKLYAPFKCYIYCTKGNPKDPHELLEIHGSDGKIRKTNGMVMGEFVCDKIYPINVFENGTIQDWNYHDLQAACVPYDDMSAYIGAGRTGRAWHISDLVIYDTPKELGEFIPVCRYGQDGECAGVAKVDCPFQKRDYNPDGGINIVDCTKRVSRAPQSWCYVEELTEGGTDNE